MTMNKIKIFDAYKIVNLEDKISKWIEHNNIAVISVRIVGIF